MKKWKVKLYYTDDEDSRHLLGDGVFFADTAVGARECAMQAWWEPRLETTGCAPSWDVQPVEEEERVEDEES